MYMLFDWVHHLLCLPTSAGLEIHVEAIHQNALFWLDCGHN